MDASQSHLFDVATARLPGLVKVFDAPALRVAVDDEARIIGILDGVAREEHPVNWLLPIGRSLLAGPHGRELDVGPLRLPIVLEIQHDLRATHDHLGHTLTTLVTPRNVEVIAGDYALFFQVIAKLHWLAGVGDQYP